MNIEEITEAQWKAFRIIQDMGLHNMSSPEAVRDSGLDIDIYRTIQKHYNELYATFEEDTDDE